MYLQFNRSERHDTSLQKGILTNTPSRHKWHLMGTWLKEWGTSCLGIAGTASEEWELSWLWRKRRLPTAKDAGKESSGRGNGMLFALSISFCLELSSPRFLYGSLYHLFQIFLCLCATFSVRDPWNPAEILKHWNISFSYFRYQIKCLFQKCLISPSQPKTAILILVMPYNIITFYFIHTTHYYLKVILVIYLFIVCPLSSPLDCRLH